MHLAVVVRKGNPFSALPLAAGRGAAPRVKELNVSRNIRVFKPGESARAAMVDCLRNTRILQSPW